jgi:hypothetical protein
METQTRINLYRLLAIGVALNMGMMQLGLF